MKSNGTDSHVFFFHFTAEVESPRHKIYFSHSITMKTLRKIGLLTALVMVFAALSSCGDDKDDEPEMGGGAGSGGDTPSASITLGGKPFDLGHCYYWYANGEMHIEFYNFDVTGGVFPNSINFLSIDYEVSSSQTSVQSVTLSSESYRLYLVNGLTQSSAGWQGETFWRDSSNSPLVIEKNGDKYSISIERATVASDTDERVLSLKYSGKINKLPEMFQE